MKTLHARITYKSFEEFVIANRAQIDREIGGIFDKLNGRISKDTIKSYYETTLEEMFKGASIQNFLIILTTTNCREHFRSPSNNSPMLESAMD